MDEKQMFTKGRMRKSTQLSIRSYRPADEQVLRDICYETGLLGRSASEWMDVNRELFSDLWLTYYLTQEPESIFVAEIDGEVVGYLTGCLDTSRQKRYSHGTLIWIMLGRFLRGRYRVGRKTFAVVGHLIRDAVRQGFPEEPWKEYPAHLHYNVWHSNRGTVDRCGMHLLDAFCGHMAASGVTKCHGLIVVPKQDVSRRYRSLGTVHDSRPTTLYQDADPREMEMMCVVFDLRKIGKRYQKWVGDIEHSSCAEATEGRPTPKGESGGLAMWMLNMGLIVAGVGAGLATWSLPLRISVPGVLLLLCAFAIRERTRVEWQFLATTYTWAWIVSCVLVARTGSWYPTASLLLAAGLALSLPAIAEVFRYRTPISSMIHIGALGGILILFLAAMGTGDRGLFLLGAGLALGYMAALAMVMTVPVRSARRSLILALSLPTAATILSVGAWQMSVNQASANQGDGSLDQALVWSERETGWAQSLGLRQGLTTALHRRAGIFQAKGDDEAWHDTLVMAARHDPLDLDAIQDLFRFASERMGREREALDCFGLLPDERIDPVAAEAVVLTILRQEAWPALTRALRLSGKGLPARPGFPVNWSGAGRALYHEGNAGAALVLLERAVSHPEADWETIRIFCTACLESDRQEDVNRILKLHEPGDHAEEHALLKALAAGIEKKVVSDLPGLAFGQKLRLTDCRMDRRILKPGDEVGLSFVWEAMKPVPPDWRVFVHVRQKVYGGAMFQGDHLFADVGRSAANWPLGASFKYAVPIKVPAHVPDGDYAVFVGIWDGKMNQAVQEDKSVEGLRIVGGNRVVIGELKVARKP